MRVYLPRCGRANRRVGELEARLLTLQREVDDKAAAFGAAESSRSGELAQLQSKLSLLEMERSGDKAEKELLLHR